MFCTQNDVEKRLRRELSDGEQEYLEGMIEEAQALVLSYLGCPPEKYADDVPDGIVLVTSRMVARVISEGEMLQPETFGATQAGITAGPYSQQVTFSAGSRTGAPWLTKPDKTILDQYRCSGRAFAIDTAPRGAGCHSVTCSAINYAHNGQPIGWQAYCTCGADIAGHPIYGEP